MGLLIRTGQPRNGKDYMVMNNLTTTLATGASNTYTELTKPGTNIVYNVEYTMLTGGSHTSSVEGAGDSFAAAPFTPVKALPPELENFSGYNSRSTQAGVSPPLYEGGFTITFDSDLYHSEGRGGTVSAVTQGRNTSNRIVGHIGKGGTNVTISEVNTVNKASSTFTFEFTNMQNGMQFVIFNDGEISSKGGQTHGAKTLTITVREKISGKTHTPYLEAELNGKKLTSADGTTWVEMT